MAWVAVDKDGTEFMCCSRPFRRYLLGEWWPDADSDRIVIPLPRGTVEKLIGKQLTWEDDPVELE